MNPPAGKLSFCSASCEVAQTPLLQFLGGSFDLSSTYPDSVQRFSSDEERREPPGSLLPRRQRDSDVRNPRLAPLVDERDCEERREQVHCEELRELVVFLRDPPLRTGSSSPWTYA